MVFGLTQVSPLNVLTYRWSVVRNLIGADSEDEELLLFDGARPAHVLQQVTQREGVAVQRHTVVLQAHFDSTAGHCFIYCIYTEGGG